MESVLKNIILVIDNYIKNIFKNSDFILYKNNLII